MFYSHCILAGKLVPASINDEGGLIPCESQGCAGASGKFIAHSLTCLSACLENLCVCWVWGIKMSGDKHPNITLIMGWGPESVEAQFMCMQYGMVWSSRTGDSLRKAGTMSGFPSLHTPWAQGGVFLKR